MVMKKVLLSLILVGIASSVFFSLNAAEDSKLAKLWAYKVISREPIHVTPAYSNAVYQATLPRLAEVIKSLPLAESSPLDATQITQFDVNVYTYPASVISLINDSCFAYNICGNAFHYDSASSWFQKGEDKNDSAFWGTTKMSTDEVVSLARETLQKLGYETKLTHSDTEPKVEGPFDTKEGHIPYAKVTWGNGSDDDWISDAETYLIEVEINTEKGQIVAFHVAPSLDDMAKASKYLVPDGIKVDVKPESRKDYLKQIYGKRSSILNKRIHITPEYSEAVLTAILPKATETASLLELPITLPVTKEQVHNFRVDDRGYVCGRFTLKDGWFFAVDRMGYVTSVISPDVFWGDRNSPMDHYYGKNQMTNEEIVQFARDVLKKLGYDKICHTERSPKVQGPLQPAGAIEKEVPRAQVEWHSQKGEPHYTVTLDINTETKQLDALRVYTDGSHSTPLEIDMIPETEEAYQARIQKEKGAAKN